jgi:hypothetical protein
MKKRIRLKDADIKNIVREKLKKDKTFINESKIDKAIREYLEKRDDGSEEDLPEKNVFSEKAKESFEDMVKALFDISEDLMLIQAKEGDVLVEDYPKEMLAEEYINNLVNQIELTIEAIEHLRDFEPGDFEEI